MEKIESMRSQKLHPHPLEDCTEDCKKRGTGKQFMFKKKKDKISKKRYQEQCQKNTKKQNIMMRNQKQLVKTTTFQPTPETTSM